MQALAPTRKTVPEVQPRLGVQLSPPGETQSGHSAQVL